MVDVLVIPDGAADACGTLDRACMPVLRSLGEAALVDVAPAHLPPGSETGIPVLLGHVPPRPVGRGWVDAAAYGVPVPEGCVPLRADVLREDGTRASADEAQAAAAQLGAIHTRGHRLLLLDLWHLSPAQWGSCAAPLRVEGFAVHVWPAGDTLPRALDGRTLVIAGPGAAVGCARLMGADVIVPAGATGDVDTDLHAKARAAIHAIEAGPPHVVVHVGAPDEAAHRRDPAGKQRALELIDAHLLRPLVDAVRAAGGTLTVCADHHTDPLTGEHGREAVRLVRWQAGAEGAVAA